tara:strand:+ start:1675 stop:2187 length:513 start_codon:yes stop_codon:yes gene_type:complete
MINQNIYLIGMMGSGKTTIGEKISKKLKMNFIDIDQQIEEIMSMSIIEIFDMFGEKRFRDMEASFLIEKSKETGIVFSTGGGIILNKLIRQYLKNSGNTFFLNTSISELKKRINNNKRPLLKQFKNIEIDLKKINEQRKNQYINSANYIIKTDNLEPDDISNKIIKIFNE